MTDFTETGTKSQWGRTPFAYLRNEHETASREIAEAAESLAELNEEETVTPASTTFDAPSLRNLLDWVRRGEIRPQLTQLSYLYSLANTESFHLDGPLSNRYVAGEYPGFQHPPETRWIQNLRHTSYQLRQPIPIVIERSGGLVTANYDDLRLEAKGDNLNDVLSDLRGKLIARYEELQESDDSKKGTAHSPEHAFLKQIIVETQPRVWEEVKQLYREKLKLFPFVEKGFINVSAPDYAEVIIILSDDSSDRIQQLAEIDLEINLKYRPLYFFVQYELSEDFLELSDYVRFY